MRHDPPPRTTCANCLAKRASIREDAGHVLYTEHKTMAALMGTRAHVNIGAAILTASLVSAPEKLRLLSKALCVSHCLPRFGLRLTPNGHGVRAFERGLDLDQMLFTENEACHRTAGLRDRRGALRV
jgi:hypothetical protein